jgi:hypothetical protein
MPKRTIQHNKTEAVLPLKPSFIAMHKPRSVADLVQSGTPRLASLAQRAKAAAVLRDEVQMLLPGRLQPHLTHASERQGELTLWVDSGAFCARLRFEIPRLKATIAAALGRPIERIRVRVRPRAEEQ